MMHLDYADDVALLAEMLETLMAGVVKTAGTPGRGCTSMTPGELVKTNIQHIGEQSLNPTL